MSNSSDYRVIKTVRGEFGEALEVTQKTIKTQEGHKRFVLSFRLYKEFERGESTAETSYMNERHIDGCHRLLEEAREVIQQEKEKQLAGIRRGG